jgi:hypothetical protein
MGLCLDSALNSKTAVTTPTCTVDRVVVRSSSSKARYATRNRSFSLSSTPFSARLLQVLLLAVLVVVVVVPLALASAAAASASASSSFTRVAGRRRSPRKTHTIHHRQPSSFRRQPACSFLKPPSCRTASAARLLAALAVLLLLLEPAEPLVKPGAALRKEGG